MITLPAPLLTETVNLLAPHLESVAARNALLDEAMGLGQRTDALKHKLSFDGTTHEFTTQLVRELTSTE